MNVKFFMNQWASRLKAATRDGPQREPTIMEKPRRKNFVAESYSLREGIPYKEEPHHHTVKTDAKKLCYQWCCGYRCSDPWRNTAETIEMRSECFVNLHHLNTMVKHKSKGKHKKSGPNNQSLINSWDEEMASDDQITTGYHRSLEQEKVINHNRTLGQNHEKRMVTY